MQVLVFNLGDQEYALPTCHVVRVLPVMTLTRLALVVPLWNQWEYTRAFLESLESSAATDSVV